MIVSIAIALLLTAFGVSITLSINKDITELRKAADK